MTGGDLTGARLQGADLNRAVLRNVVLAGADLRGANLRWVDLRGADLRRADLRDADLRGAKLGGADLTDARTEGMRSDRPVAGLPARRPGNFGAARTTVPSSMPDDGADVRFSAFHRAQNTEGDATLLVFIHGSDASGEVARRAEVGLDDASPLHSASDPWPLAVGQRVRVRPQAEGVRFSPEQVTVTWRGIIEEVPFRMQPAAGVTTVSGNVAVYLGLMNIARIPLDLTFAAAGRKARAPRPQTARPFRKIFTSYSRKDLDVVRLVQRFTSATGDRYLHDVDDLRAGEEWQESIRDLIEEADVFQLFWSTNSMRSPLVRQEWEYALDLRRADFVRPTFWEHPLPRDPERSLPPDGLRALHFHDIGPLQEEVR